MSRKVAFYGLSGSRKVIDQETGEDLAAAQRASIPAEQYNIVDDSALDKYRDRNHDKDPMSLDNGMLAIAERMREVAAGGPATIEHCYVFNDQDSSKTGHHWFTVCLSVTRVGENENVPSPEKHSHKTISLDLSPEKQSPKKQALMERSPERPRRRRIIHDAEMDT